METGLAGQSGIERRLDVRAVCFTNVLPRSKSHRRGEKSSMLPKCVVWMGLSDEAEMPKRVKREGKSRKPRRPGRDYS